MSSSWDGIGHSVAWSLLVPRRCRKTNRRSITLPARTGRHSAGFRFGQDDYIPVVYDQQSLLWRCLREVQWLSCRKSQVAARSLPPRVFGLSYCSGVGEGWWLTISGPSVADAPEVV